MIFHPFWVFLVSGATTWQVNDLFVLLGFRASRDRCFRCTSKVKTRVNSVVPSCFLSSPSDFSAVWRIVCVNDMEVDCFSKRRQQRKFLQWS